jgi:hypothetical protein
MPLGSKRESIKVSRFWSDHLKDPGIGNKQKEGYSKKRMDVE